jgi:hypothetical protein
MVSTSSLELATLSALLSTVTSPPGTLKVAAPTGAGVIEAANTDSKKRKVAILGRRDPSRISIAGFSKQAGLPLT